MFHSTEMAKAALAGGGATILVPVRASGVDQYLADASGTPYTDSGAPFYAYDGTGGSDDIDLDPILPSTGAAPALGDAVGTQRVWDAEQGVGVGTVTGIPYQVRYTDGAPGAGAQFSTSRYATLPASVFSAGTESYVLYFAPAATGFPCRILDCGYNIGGTGLLVWQSSASAVSVRYYQGGGFSNLLLPGFGFGTTVALVIECDWTGGALRAATYDADTGAVLTATVSAADVFAPVSDHRLGAQRNDGSNPFRGATLALDMFAGLRLLSDYDPADLALDRTLGGLRTSSYAGVRTGVLRTASPTTLIIGTGAGSTCLVGAT